MPPDAGEQRGGSSRTSPPPEAQPSPEERSELQGSPDGSDEEKGRAARMAEQLTERRERHKQRARLHRAAITAAGFVLVLVGIVLSGPGIPGPGFLVILIGLAVLALEFDWAERLLRKGLHHADRAGAAASEMSTRRKVVIGILSVAAVAAAIAAVFVFDIPIPIIND